MTRGSDGYLAEIETWRTRRLARLTAPDGWLSVIGLHWLEEGANAIGSATSARIRLPEGRGADDLGWIEVAEGDAILHSGGRAVPLAADPADERPFLRQGSLSLSLIRRGERMAVRVRDGQSELRKRFRAVAAFPVDPAWRIEARFEPHALPLPIPIPNVLGTMDQEISPGTLLFDAGGDIRRLDPILEAGESDYWGHLQRRHQRPGDVRRRTVRVRVAADEGSDHHRLQQGLQPAVRVHALLDVPAPAAPESVDASRRGGREDILDFRFWILD